MKVRLNGVVKSISDGAVRIGGASKALARIAYYDGSAIKTLKTFTKDLTASVLPSAVNGDVVGGGLATTQSVTVTPEGGTGPFTYSWVRQSGSGSITHPNRANTQFTYFFNEGGGDETGTFQCTVTDSLGATAQVFVVANFSSFSNL